MMNRALPAMILGIALLGCGAKEERPNDDGSEETGGSGGAKASGGSGGKASGSGGKAAGGSGGSGEGGSASGGSASGGSASGGKTGSGGTPGTGGSASGGSGSGGSASGGTPGTGGSGSGGASGMGGAGSSNPAAAYFKMNCECPVLSGFKPEEFCSAYTEICGYTGANRYADEAACLKGFKGLASDADAKKAGALCCAYKMPEMKESRCAAAK